MTCGFSASRDDGCSKFRESGKPLLFLLEAPVSLRLVYA